MSLFAQHIPNLILKHEINPKKCSSGYLDQDTYKLTNLASLCCHQISVKSTLWLFRSRIQILERGKSFIGKESKYSWWFAMPEEKKIKLKEGQVSYSGSFSVNLDVDKLNKMTSGSCVIGSTIPVADEEPEKIAVCKEGKTIKIFKIFEEKK